MATVKQKRGASAGFGYISGRGARCALRNWGNSPVLRSGNRIAVFSVLLALLALFALTACNGKWWLPKPPFRTPVDLAREGVVADFDIRVTRHDLYLFGFRFKFPAKDQAERERVGKIVGDSFEPALVPAPVKLTIFKKQAQDEQIYYQKTIEKPAITSYSSDSFGARLGHCDLPRGKYRFVLESLASPREYESIPTVFYVASRNRFKFSFDPKNADRSMSCPQKYTRS